MSKKMPRKEYERELARLQADLVDLQSWVRKEGKRVCVLFEGRDAAGKGGMIRRITERVSARVFRVVALPAPSDREASQWYFQRYIQHLPAAGEVVLFDRSWYNRAGVEKVMGFCTDEEYERFLAVCPGFEQALIMSGMILIKYWLTVDSDRQLKRFQDRATDPRKQWKLSPMDLESRRRWYDYSRARDAMMEATDRSRSPWYVIDANDKRRARLNCIAHLLSLLPHDHVAPDVPELPPRDLSDEYDDDAPLAKRRQVPAVY